MRGLVLGKFMPPHQGHLYLVDFARHFVDELTVVVGSLASEPIPGELRCRWMREIFPEVRVVHCSDENPQLPDQHADFWGIWRRSLERAAGPVELLFASEPYGERLAQELGARFIPTNGARALFPVSGTAVREHPWEHWDALPRPVRPYFLQRVSIFGPESTGKSTLAARLAAHYQTLHVPEFARTWLEAREGVTLEDMPIIARGQAASEDAMALQANRRLFCDTDPLATVIWSRELFGHCQAEVERRGYDLTLLLDVDVPWVADPVRYRPENRQRFHAECRRALEGRRVVEIRGTFEQRFEQARAAVDRLTQFE